jgi:Tfp pilus assembly protein PilF
MSLTSTSLTSTAAAPQRLEPPASPWKNIFRSVFRTPGRQTLLFCLILTVMVLVVYAPITHNDFVRYDDDGYITDNPDVQQGLRCSTVKWAFTTYDQANWHPLTWLSHALDCELFGLNPAGHHYVNVLLHAANVVLLFLMLQSATGFRWRSLMVAALFALHPINVESVAWAAERKNVLSMLFFLLALYAYVWYAHKPALGRYAAVCGFFALALLSKPQVITLPILLFLWDYWPLCRFGSGAAGCASQDWPEPSRSIRPGAASISSLILEKLPLLLLSAASAIVTIKAQRAGNAIQTFTQFGPLLRIETSAISYLRYGEKAFWPTKLVALYPHPSKLYPAWQVGAAVLVLILITALVMRARDRRYLAVGWLWFLISLVPMIGLVQVGFQAMADRYAYIPFIGLFLMFTWLAADLAQIHLINARQISSKALAIPAVACLLALGVLTYRQVGYWHDTLSFWQRTLALTHDNYVAEDNLGEFLFKDGTYDQAAEHFRAALAIRPEGLVANLNLGMYEDRRGNLAAAIEHYKLVAARAGDIGMRATAYGSLGFVYRQMGETAKAKECFETALQLAPMRARARVGLGLVAQDTGDLPGAIQQYSLAAAVQPSEVVELLLAQALQRAGHAEDAKAIFERVARSPNLPQAQKETQRLLSPK